MKVKEMIKLLSKHDPNMELIDVGIDSGHGYSREVVRRISGVRKTYDGLVFVLGDEIKEDNTQDLLEILKHFIRRGY